MTSNKTTQNISVLLKIYLAIFALLMAEVKGTEEPLSNIIKLQKELLSNYDKFARPSKNASIPVPVSVQLTPLSLMEINEKEETMVLNAWIPMKWKDEHLTWEMDQHGGIERIHLTENEIWGPNVIVLNSAPATNTLPWHKSNMMVYHTGYVYWALSSAISTRCPMTFLAPEEERTCNISLGSWINPNTEIELKLYWEGVIFRYLSNNNSMWIVRNISVILHPIELNPLYTAITFSVKVQRRHDFTDDITSGPRLISILLILSMFWIPPKSKEKLKLGCLALILISGMMIYLSSTVSSPSLVSAKVSLLRITLLTAASALLMEVIILNISGLSDVLRPSPKLIHMLTGVMGRIIAVCPQLQKDEDKELDRLPEPDQPGFSDSLIVENEWLLVATTLDKLCFFIIAVVFLLTSFIV